MGEKILFTVNSSSMHDGCVHAVSPTINSKICTVVPPPFHNGTSGKWSAEHLFLASIGNCYLHTFMVLAEMMKLPFDNISCNVEGTVEKQDGVLTFQTIMIEATLTINNQNLREKAQKVLERAARNCIVKNSIKAQFEIETQIAVNTRYELVEQLACV